jgi:hypothetical protein
MALRQETSATSRCSTFSFSTCSWKILKQNSSAPRTFTDPKKERQNVVFTECYQRGRLLGESDQCRVTEVTPAVQEERKIHLEISCEDDILVFEIGSLNIIWLEIVMSDFKTPAFKQTYSAIKSIKNIPTHTYT